MRIVTANNGMIRTEQANRALKGRGDGLDLEIKTGYRIADPATLMNFMLESAWSVRDGFMPNTSIDITLIGADEAVDLARRRAGSGLGPLLGGVSRSSG